ncbi:hypothetical protein TNCV_2646631 [Trichonephila clavipes]|nr:hypothetical protein TNCV_2646631 [Trichonephila clavipes]
MGFWCISLCAPVLDRQDMAYPGHWIGHIGPVLWPPHSSDLTPLVFFLRANPSQRIGASTTRIDLVASLPAAFLH